MNQFLKSSVLCGHRLHFWITSWLIFFLLFILYMQTHSWNNNLLAFVVSSILHTDTIYILEQLLDQVLLSLVLYVKAQTIFLNKNSIIFCFQWYLTCSHRLYFCIIIWSAFSLIGTLHADTDYIFQNNYLICFCCRLTFIFRHRMHFWITSWLVFVIIGTIYAQTDYIFWIIWPVFVVTIL